MNLPYSHSEIAGIATITPLTLFFSFDKCFILPLPLYSNKKYSLGMFYKDSIL